MKIDKSRIEKAFKYVLITYILIYFLIAVFSIKDYGWSYDDASQRLHSLVNYKYIFKTIFNRDLSQYSTFDNVPELQDYISKYYGVLLQIPFVLIEHLFDFTLPTKAIYLIKHMGILFYSCLGYFFFYLFVKKITGSRIYGFFGLLLISLYPRFFGEKFYNVKDQVFVATCCLAYYGIALYLENKRNIKYGVLAGLFFAISACSRMMAIMFPIILIGYLVLQDIREKAFTNKKVELGKHLIPQYLKCIIDYLSILIPFLTLWYLGTPAAWGKNVFTSMYEAFTYFGYYDSWQGTSLFAGQNLTPEEMPWHYIYTWIGITVPIYYIVLFFIGHVYLFKKSDDGVLGWINRTLSKDKYIALAVVMFWGPSILVVLHKIKIYTAWRHMYFLMCPIIILSVYGLKFLVESFKGKAGNIIRYSSLAVVTLCLLIQVNWIRVNHPYEYVYFNILGQKVAFQYDRDVFRVTSYDLVEYILKNDDREVITIGEPSEYGTDLLNLTEAEKARIKNVSENGDYLVECYRSIAGNDYCPEGYYEYYSIVVDGNKFGTVFKRIEKTSSSEKVVDPITTQTVDVFAFVGQSNIRIRVSKAPIIIY